MELALWLLELIVKPRKIPYSSQSLLFKRTSARRILAVVENLRATSALSIVELFTSVIRYKESFLEMSRRTQGPDRDTDTLKGGGGSIVYQSEHMNKSRRSLTALDEQLHVRLF